MWTLWIYVAETVVIVTGNVAVLVVFTRTPALRKRKHYLLVNLAVADLLVGVISVPMYITILVSGYSDSIRMIYKVQDPLLGTASVFGLTAVAIERAYAVYFPFRHRTLWKGVYMIGIAVIWIMAAFPGFCFIIFDSSLQFYAANMAVALSLAGIILSYFLIWIKMNCMASVRGRAIHARDNRLTVTLVIVTLISLIAWIPFQALMVYNYLCQPHCLIGKYFVVDSAKSLHYGNSWVNPIIYALRMPQFKTALLQGVRRCLACNNRNSNRQDHDYDNGIGNHGNNDNELELNNMANNDDRRC